LGIEVEDNSVENLALCVCMCVCVCVLAWEGVVVAWIKMT